MVRSEDRPKEVGMAREIGRSSAGGTGGLPLSEDDRVCAKIKEHIDKTEKEIVRITLIAEKEKRESLAIHAKIKRMFSLYSHT